MAFNFDIDNVLGPRCPTDYDAGEKGYCYVTVGVDLDAQLETIYFVKIGKGKYPDERTNAQRLKLIGYANNNWVKTGCGGMVCLEEYLIRKGQKTYGRPALGYKPAGYTEMVGAFSSAKKAVAVAHEMLDEILIATPRKVFRYTKHSYLRKGRDGYVEDICSTSSAA
jgi:hypothetical protein